MLRSPQSFLSGCIAKPLDLALFFEMAASHNEINVLQRSQLFAKLCNFHLVHRSNRGTKVSIRSSLQVRTHGAQRDSKSFTWCWSAITCVASKRSNECTSRGSLLSILVEDNIVLIKVLEWVARCLRHNKRLNNLFLEGFKCSVASES